MRIGPDPARVVAKPFIRPPDFGGPTMRVDRIIERLRALDDPEVSTAIDDGRRRRSGATATSNPPGLPMADSPVI